MYNFSGCPKLRRLCIYFLHSYLNLLASYELNKYIVTILPVSVFVLVYLL